MSYYANVQPGFRPEDAARMEEILGRSEGRDLNDGELNEMAALETKLVRAQADERRRTVVTDRVHGVVPTDDDDAGVTDAFRNYLRTGRESSDLQTIRNAQGVGSGSSGGYLVPQGFRQRLTERLLAFGGIARLAESLTTDTGNNLPWPTIDDTANVGEIVSEGGTFSAGADLVFGEKSLGAFRYAAGGASSTPIRISVELLQDSGIDIEGVVAAKLGERIGRVQATHLVTGSGVGEPLGIVTGLTGVQTGSIATGITYDDLLNFVHSVDSAYRDAPAGDVAWVFNDATLQRIRGIKDSNGDPLWRPSLFDAGVMAVSGSLLGFPVLVDPAFPDFNASSTSTNWGVFGNIRAGYVVRRVKDVVIAVNPYSRMANGQVEYSAWARMDATQQDTHAYVCMTGAAA